MLLSLSFNQACVSSRLWETLEKDFIEDDKTSIKIDELTLEGIKTYIHDVIGGSKDFKALAQHDPKYDSLIEELIYAAKGVFCGCNWRHDISLMASQTKTGWKTSKTDSTNFHRNLNNSISLFLSLSPKSTRNVSLDP